MNIYYEQFSHLSKNDHFFNRYLKLINIFKERNFKKAKGLHNHHIFPKSFGGEESFENMVYCSIKEHYILHHLLWKSFPTSKMTYAFFRMAHSKKYNNKITSKVYEQLKKENNLRHSETMTGTKHTEATKKKISDANRGKKRTPEFCQRSSEINTGRKHTEETKQKLSDINTGKSLTEEHKQNIGKSRKGIPLSEVTKKKIGDANRGKKLPKQSAETIKKRADSNRGKKRTPESIKKSADAQRGKPKSAETRQKISDTLKGRITINNGVNQKSILPEELQSYLDLGWEISILETTKQKIAIGNSGKIRSKETKQQISDSLKGRIIINNGVNQKQIKPEFLQEHLDLGWKIGCLPRSVESIIKQKETWRLKSLAKIKNGL